ncbi:MAG: acyltransferase [Bacteroidota bacterium]
MRIVSLDYLRGFAALGIMVYHYAVWTFGAYTSETILGKVGIYGVSVFYVLSGMTLFVVYKDKLQLTQLFSYAVKRVVRIFPLMWLSVFLTIFLLTKTYPDNKIILNLTGLFGFVARHEYIPTGAWSIGNELVFYTIFPVVLIFTKRARLILELFFIGSLISTIYFSFHVVPSFESLGAAWKVYIHPLNQLFLFLGGVLLAKYLYRYRGLWPGLISILGGFLVFIPVLAKGDLLNIVSGINRFLYGLGCFLLCAGTLIIPLKKIKIFHEPLKLLGDASYSIYLIHPIVYWFLANHFFSKGGSAWFLGTAVLTTLIISFVSYFFMEKYFIKLGKRLTSTIETTNRSFYFKSSAILSIAFILVFQANRRSQQIEQQKLLEKQLGMAQTPYSRILTHRSVYRDSVYRVYIANIKNVNMLIFLATDSLTQMQKESNFFVHLYPKNKELLEKDNTHLNLNFENLPQQFEVGNKKYFYSSRTLPDLEVEKLNLGQYGFQGNNGINWKTNKLLLAEDIARILKDNDEEMPIFKFTRDNF